MIHLNVSPNATLQEAIEDAIYIRYVKHKNRLNHPEYDDDISFTYNGVILVVTTYSTPKTVLADYYNNGPT